MAERVHDGAVRRRVWLTGATLPLLLLQLGSTCDGLVAHWTLDEATGTTAESAILDGNPITLKNGFAFDSHSVPGREGNALRFDGDDYVEVTAPDNLFTTSDFSVAAWIRVESNKDPVGTAYRIIQKRGTGAFGTQAGWQLVLVKTSSSPERYRVADTGIDDGVNAFGIDASAPETTIDIRPGVWTHLAFVWDAPNRLIPFVNGVADTTAPRRSGHADLGDIFTTRKCTFGAAWDSDSAQSAFFKGTLDDVRVYNEALSPDTVLELAGGLNAGLVAYWPLDDTGEAAAGDATINGHTAALTAMDPAAAWTMGPSGAALEFDGLDDQLVASDSANLSFGHSTQDESFSIAAWCQLERVDGFSVVCKPGEYQLYTDGAGRLTFEVADESGNVLRATGSDLQALTGQWIHLCATYDGSGSASGLALYVNGAADSYTISEIGTYSAMTDGEKSLTIGASDAGFAQGRLDEIRLYGRALSADQAAALFNLNLVPATPTALDVEDCDEGSIATDVTPTLTFELADHNADNSLHYQVQIDEQADFGSALIDYLSGPQDFGAASFTVGQGAGSGAYIAGSGQDGLADGAYYWRVRSFDGALFSGWSDAQELTVTQAVIAPASASYSVQENSQATLTFQLSAAACHPISVDYAASDNTAEQGHDYAPAAGTLMFTPGETQKSVTIDVSADIKSEAAESFVVTLFNPSGAALPAGYTPTVVTVLDDDPAGVVLTASGEDTKVKEASTTDSYTLALTAEPSATVTVHILPGDQLDVGAGPGAPHEVVFDANNWNIPQEVMVSTPDDLAVENPWTWHVIAHQVVSGDPLFDGLAVADLEVLVRDNERLLIPGRDHGGPTTGKPGPLPELHDPQPGSELGLVEDPGLEQSDPPADQDLEAEPTPDQRPGQQPDRSPSPPRDDAPTERPGELAPIEGDPEPGPPPEAQDLTTPDPDEPSATNNGVPNGPDAVDGDVPGAPDAHEPIADDSTEDNNDEQAFQHSGNLCGVGLSAPLTLWPLLMLGAGATRTRRGRGNQVR